MSELEIAETEYLEAARVRFKTYPSGEEWSRVCSIMVNKYLIFKLIKMGKTIEEAKAMISLGYGPSDEDIKIWRNHDQFLIREDFIDSVMKKQGLSRKEAEFLCVTERSIHYPCQELQGSLGNRITGKKYSPELVDYLVEIEYHHQPIPFGKLAGRCRCRTDESRYKTHPEEYFPCEIRVNAYEGVDQETIEWVNLIMEEPLRLQKIKDQEDLFHLNRLFGVDQNNPNPNLALEEGFHRFIDGLSDGTIILDLKDKNDDELDI